MSSPAVAAPARGVPVSVGGILWNVAALRRPCQRNRYYEEYGWRAVPRDARVTIQRIQNELLEPFACGRASGQELDAAWTKSVLSMDLQPVESLTLVGPEEWGWGRPALLRRLDSLRTEFADLLVSLAGGARLLEWSEATRLACRALVRFVCAAAAQRWQRIEEAPDEPESKGATLELVQSHPELTAFGLAAGVLEPQECEELRRRNFVTVKAPPYIYRVHRRPHEFIEMWESESLAPAARFCVVFKGPVMPPSDELIMRYVLVKHDLDGLWRTANVFPFNEPFVP